jgi:hypothetical protein
LGLSPVIYIVAIEAFEFGDSTLGIGTWAIELSLFKVNVLDRRPESYFLSDDTLFLVRPDGA